MHPLLHRCHLLSIILPPSGSRHRVTSAGSATPSLHSSSSSAFSSSNNSNTITISHVNINSITSLCRLDELSHFSFLNDIDILYLTETKLDETVHPSLFSLDNYHSPLTRHRNRNGGGVAVYVRNNIAVKRLHNLETPGVEWIWCLVKIRKNNPCNLFSLCPSKFIFGSVFLCYNQAIWKHFGSTTLCSRQHRDSWRFQCWQFISSSNII